jgi:hypothetical protein
MIEEDVHENITLKIKSNYNSFCYLGRRLHGQAIEDLREDPREDLGDKDPRQEEPGSGILVESYSQTSTDIFQNLA